RGRGWQSAHVPLGRNGTRTLLLVSRGLSPRACRDRSGAPSAHRRRFVRQLRPSDPESPAARARTAFLLGSIAARRRDAVTGASVWRMPPFVVAVVTAYFLRAAAGMVTALPLVFGVAASGAERLESDRALFAPGALLLVELVRTGAATLLA